MTFEKILSDLSSQKITPEEVYNIMSEKENLKKINYYSIIMNYKKEPLSDGQLRELETIVDILQILYTSSVGSPVPDTTFDLLQETLIDMGVPRLTGSIEINDSKKQSHKFTTLRGTLDKVYYLSPEEVQTNKSRKYLDQWISSAEDLYFSRTGKRINLNEEKVIIQAKYDGTSAILEWDGKEALWLSRGDTQNNRASDITHIMKIFNDVYCGSESVGIKFEVMMTMEDTDVVNSLSVQQYKNSRQVVTAILNSKEADFRSQYLFPVPLRIIHPGEDVEQVHPDHIKYFPTMICKLGERDKIRDFANHHRYVEHNGKRLRTDGAVITILDPNIQRVLGRDNNINNFEVAYKFTEESAITRVKDVEFYISDFGFITPVLVVNDVILKGNTINHISLSNKERFDELDLAYGDEVKVLYDIIPYATIDDSCQLIKHGRKIKFISECPKCYEPLELNVTQVQCKNPRCPSRLIGRILNYCEVLRIQNIGYNTLDQLYSVGLLKDGILSLYKLKKKSGEIEDLEGFGRLKTKKIISEIEAKRRLKDYEFFGAIGIQSLSLKTFQMIFQSIKLDEFMDLIQLKNYGLLKAKLESVSSIGPAKSEVLVNWIRDKDNRKELEKLLKEVILYPSYIEGGNKMKIVVFTGCRADVDLRRILEEHGYQASDNWNNSATYLVVPNKEYNSSKVNKAIAKNVPIIPIEDLLTEIIK